MRLKFIRSIAVVLGIAALLLVAPTVCAASMDMPAMQESSPCQQETSGTPCFTATSGSLSHCVLIRALGEQVKPPKLISYQNVCLSRCLEDSTGTGPSQLQSAPYQSDILKIPLSTPTEHRCRNILGSEEPPL